MAICIPIKGLHGIPSLLLWQEQHEVIQLHMSAALRSSKFHNSQAALLPTLAGVSGICHSLFLTIWRNARWLELRYLSKVALQFQNM